MEFLLNRRERKRNLLDDRGLEVIPGNPGSKCQFIVERKAEMK